VTRNLIGRQNGTMHDPLSRRMRSGRGAGKMGIPLRSVLRAISPAPACAQRWYGKSYDRCFVSVSRD